MSLWFSASAVTPQLQSIWGLTTVEAAWLTTVVQFGFVCGTAVAAVLNLADLIPAGRFFSACALLGAAANAAILERLGAKSDTRVLESLANSTRSNPIRLFESLSGKAKEFEALSATATLICCR